VRLLRRQRAAPQAKTGRPAERYLAVGADEARWLGQRTVGTEHVLLALTRDPGGEGSKILRQLDVSHGDIAESPCLAGTPTRRIDPDALAALGIDLDTCANASTRRSGRTRSSRPAQVAWASCRG